MNLEEKQLIFERVNIQIFYQIVQFLAPKDICQAVQVSRQTRLLIGQVFTDVFIKQKQILQSKENYYLQQSLDVFKEYQTLLQDSKVFASESNFILFLKLLTSNNIDYFKNFFSAVLDRDLKLNKKNLKLQKLGLSQMHQQIYISLQQWAKSDKIPSFKVQSSYCVGFLQNQLIHILKFVDQYLKNLKTLQQIEDVEQKYKNFIQAQHYLNTFKNIDKLTYKGTYKRQIYFLKFNKCYHKYIGFNINTIIFSFLSVYELQKLYSVDRIFANQVLRSIDILRNNLTLYLESTQSIDQSQNFKEIYEQFLAIRKINLGKRDIYEIRAYNNPPQACLLTINMLMNLFSLPMKENFRHNMTILAFENTQTQAFLFGYEFLELNEKRMQILESYFNSVTERQARSQSYFCYKVYNHLKVIYLACQNQISFEQIHKFHTEQLKKDSLIQHIQNLSNLYQQLLSEEQQNKLANQIIRQN